MGSFSRGCCSRLLHLTNDHQRLFTRLQSMRHLQCQLFRHAYQKSQRYSFASKVKRPTRPSTVTKAPSTKPPPPLEHQTPNHPTYPVPRSVYAASLARKQSPTVLYSNLGDNTNTFAIIAGAYCIGYGATWVYEGGFVQRPGLWIGVSYMNLFGGLVIMGIGLSILTRLRGQVVKIEAVPMMQGKGLKLRISKRNWLKAGWPNWRTLPTIAWNYPSTIECAVQDMKMRETIMTIKKAWVYKTQAQKQEERKKIRDNDPAGGNILLAPIKNVFRGFRTMMLKVLVGEGYANFRIDGQPRQFRMDIKTGWLLDEGDALDRLLSEK